MKQVQLKDGRSALNLIPDYSGQLAIVSLAVLQKLSRLLPEASAYDIITTMMEKLRILRSSDANNKDVLEQYVQMLEDEVAFHRSVNLITTIKPEDIKPELSKAQEAWKLHSEEPDKLISFVRNENIIDVQELFELADKKWGTSMPHALGTAFWDRTLRPQGWGMEAQDAAMEG